MSLAREFWFNRLHSQLHRAAGSLLHRGLRGSVQRAQASPSSESAPALPLPAVQQRFVLVADVSVPRPEYDSGSVRMQQMLQLLRQHGYAVVFLSQAPNPPADAVRRLQAMQIPVLCAGTRPQMHWLAQHASLLHAAILSRHHVAGHWLPALRRLAPQARLIFDSVDLHFLREQREAARNGAWLQARLASWTAQRELRLLAQADYTWVVSPVEAALLQAQAPQGRLKVVSNIVDIAEQPAGFAARNGFMFVGGFGHRPNVDAVQWLLEQIQPQLHAQLPDAPLHVVGANMPESLLALARRRPGVVVHGHVADLQPLLDSVRVGIAPLRYGAGVKGKVNLSLSQGIPMVSTHSAAEGMGLSHGTHILLADNPQDFAERALQLHQDAALWQHLATHGLEHMHDTFSPEAAWKVMAQCLPPV